MSPYKKKTRSTNKISESTNTIISHPVISTNNDNNASTSQDPDPVPVIINPPRIPAHFASLLRGHGSVGNSGYRPLFKGNHEVYHLFSVKLNNWIMIHDLEDFLNDESDDDQIKNLCLFVLIIGCLDGDPLHLVSTTAKGDGKSAYKLLNEKYLGNFNARKCKHLNEVSSLQQFSNEGVPSYISRVDVMITKGKQFGVFNDTSYYVIRTLQGLLPKFEMFKTVINSNLEIPEWSDFKVRIQNHDQLHSAPKINQNASVMNIVANNDSVPQINKKRKVNFKKFINKSVSKCDNCYATDHTTGNCNSVMFCTNCNNASHYTQNCRRLKIGTQRGRGGGGGATGGYGRGGHQRGGGRGRPRYPHGGRGSSNARGGGYGSRGGSTGVQHRGGGGGGGRGHMHGPPTHSSQFHNQQYQGQQQYQNTGNYANYCNPMEWNQFT